MKWRLGWRVAILCAALVGPPAATAQAVEATLPAPTGPFGVGRLQVTIADPTRREVLTTLPSDIRRLPVTLFYPAARRCSPSPYWPDSLAEVYARELGLAPDFAGRVRGHACADAPIVRRPQPFPLVLFSHGLLHTHFSYVSLLEDLASRGNIVVAIDHSYGSFATYFPGEPLALWDNGVWRRGEPGEHFARAGAEYYRLWAEDARRVLDLIEGRDQRGPFARLACCHDSDRIAYIGHSYGGMAALHAARLDMRIRGAVNLDGVTIDRNRADGVWRDRMLSPVAADVPLLVLNSAAYREEASYAPSVRVVRVAGSNHMSFSDVVWLAENFATLPLPDQPDRWTGIAGIEGTRGALAAFLDCVFDRRCTDLDARTERLRATDPAPQP